MDSIDNFARNVGIGTWLRRCRKSRTFTFGCCTRGDCPPGNSGTTSRLAINQLVSVYRIDKMFCLPKETAYV